MHTVPIPVIGTSRGGTCARNIIALTGESTALSETLTERYFQISVTPSR